MKKLTCKCVFNENGSCFFNELPKTCGLQINKEIVTKILNNAKEEK